MVTVKTVVIMMVMVMVVNSNTTTNTTRIAHRIKKGHKKQYKRTLTLPDEFLVWHSYNQRFLGHIGTPPSELSKDQIKPHFSTLLVDLDFLPEVNRYVDAHLSNVTSEGQAWRVFTLLDLYSAQDPLRHRYLYKMRERLVRMFEENPDLIKHTVTISFVLDGFDRHVEAMKNGTRALYRRVMIPKPSNLNLLAYYWPGRQPSLDMALKRHRLPSPFMSMDEGNWFYITQADPPHMTLSIDLVTWELILVNNTFYRTLFRFDPVQMPFNAVRYAVRNAAISNAAHLSFPCHQRSLCFGYQKQAKVEVMKLPKGEAVLTHKHGDRVLFLQHSHHNNNTHHHHHQGNKPNTHHQLVIKPRLTHGYPGHTAHWRLVQTRHDSRSP